MGDPHNPKRAGEIWDQARIDAQLAELKAIKEFVVISGGWAWHFMSPKGHPEIKTQHDHKDLDVFVDPGDFAELRQMFVERGFKRQRTQYDRPSGKFYRFTKYIEGGKIVFDVFLEQVPYIQIRGFNVVEPETLLSFYSTKHSSRECHAVIQAKKLVAKGISPVGRPELVEGVR